MAHQASAEGEKRATITKAEGDRLAAINLAEAAKLMAENPIALELRTLQTIDGLANSPSNTVILFPMELPLIQGTLNYTEQIVHCIQYETCIISSLVRKNSDIISSVSSRSLSRPQWLPRKEERSQALWIIYLKLCGIPPSCPVMGRMQSLLS